MTACVTAVTAGAGDWPQLGGGGDGGQARQQELPVLSVLVGLEPVAGHLVHALSVGVMVAGPVVDVVELELNDSLYDSCNSLPVVDVVEVEGRHGHVRLADLQVGVVGVE